MIYNPLTYLFNIVGRKLFNPISTVPPTPPPPPATRYFLLLALTSD